MLLRIPRPINFSHTHLLNKKAMGAYQSSDGREKHPEVGAGARVSKKVCLVESTDSSIESNGEWEDLPPLPDISGSTFDDRHYVLHLRLLGHRHVGKTKLMSRFVEDTYDEGYSAYSWSDIEPDFRIRSITMDERVFKLLIWDENYWPGEERTPLSTLCSNPRLYKSTSGIFLVYSKLDKSSFEKLSELVDVIKENAPQTLPLTLLGNKCDSKRKLDDENKYVDYYKAKEFADKHGMAFFEVSAKDGTNVELAVTDMVAKIWRTMIKQHSLHHQ